MTRFCPDIAMWKLWILLLLVPFATGCGPQVQEVKKPEKTETPAPPPEAPKKADSKELAELRDQLYEQRVKSQMLQNLVETLKQQKAKEEKDSPDGLAKKETQDAYAKAQVDLKDSLKPLSEKLDLVVEELKKEKIVKLNLTPEDIEQITKGNKPTPASGAPGAEGPSGTPKGDTAADEAKEAMKAICTMVGAALCVAQPELCPLLGPIFEMLGLFGSTEEQTAFLDAVGTFADGQPLTDAQTAVVKQVADKGYPLLPGGTMKLIKLMGEKNPTVKKAYEEADRKLFNSLGIQQADYEDLKAVLSSGASPEDKIKKIKGMFPTFPNPDVQKAVAGLAAELAGKQVGEAVLQLGKE